MRARTPLVLLFLALAASLSPLGAQVVPLEPLTLPNADWTIRLHRAEELLRGGKWRNGRAEAKALIEQMQLLPVQGEGLSELLGRAVALRAIGTAGLGEKEDAAWDAASARAIGFDWGALDLAAYGKAGEQLRGALGSPAADESEALRVGDGVSRPEIRKRTDFRYPTSLRAERINGTVIAEAIIDERGLLHHPKILNLDQTHPLLALAALDALHEWRFEPAKQNGRPVPVHYVLTTSFKVE